MRFRLAFLLGLVLVSPAQGQDPTAKITLVIHGGSGNLTPSRIPPDMQQRHSEALEQALRAGHAILMSGGSSVDAVETAIRVMEDSPLFNAGKGAVRTRDGTVELDASIMDGRNKLAGAVATVKVIKNPISAARLVMERSPHVMMSGGGAEEFAARLGLEIVDPSYFLTDNPSAEPRRRAVRRAGIPAKPAPKYGTVGAVALDRYGSLAAGTSTGGLQGKLPGRVGDSPIIGAGTYADNQTAAISCTGIGEFFIRHLVAYDIAALMKYRGMTVQQAADEVILRKLPEVGGQGGVVALDANGNFTMPFNTAGMFRGYIRADGAPHTAIFRD